MDLPYTKDLQAGGFNYDLALRNAALSKSGVAETPKTTSTGTTIVATHFKVPQPIPLILFQDGIAFAADTRATAGSLIGDKNCEKIHKLAANVFACGAGTAADCDHVTGKRSAPFCSELTKFVEMIVRELELHRLNTRLPNRVRHATTRLNAHCFNYQGHIGAHLIVGGVDCQGPQLYETSNDGTTVQMPYVTTGSGSLAAMGVFETTFKENMTEEEAKNMVIAGIEAGIYHDLGSGSCVDVLIVRRDFSVSHFRNIKSDNFKHYTKPGGFQLRKDKIQVVEEKRYKIGGNEAAPSQHEAMEVEP